MQFRWLLFSFVFAVAALVVLAGSRGDTREERVPPVSEEVIPRVPVTGVPVPGTEQARESRAVPTAAELASPEEAVLSLIITLRHGPPVGQTPEDAAAAGAPADTVFQQGEPIDVAFTITNKGEKAFGYTDRSYDRSGRMDEYALEVTDDGGRTLEDPRAVDSVGPGGGICGRGYIWPAESFTKHIYLNQWVMPLTPGRYAVVGVYWRELFRRSDGMAVRSLPVEIEVRPRAEADMQAYIEHLAGELQSEERNVRIQAVRYLGFTANSYALPYITRGFYDNAPGVPFWAGEAFLYMTDEDACIKALLTSLNERGPAPRLHELLYHYQVPKSQTLAPTIKGLSDPDPARRAGAATALRWYSAMGDAPLDALLDALKDEDPQVQKSAAAALSNYRMPRATEALLAASHDPNEQVKRTVVSTLGTIKAEAAIPRLRELIEDTPMIAVAAVGALKNIGTPEAADALRGGLEVAEEKVRVRAAIALLSLGDDSVRELLAEALESATLPGDASYIRNLLGNAVEKRGIPGPGPEGEAHSPDSEAWLKWLRQRPSDPTTP